MSPFEEDYVLAKILQNGPKFIQKLTPGFKITWEIWATSDEKWKVQTSCNLMGFCVQKYIPSAKANTEDLSNITFNYLRENSLNYLCHFWNHKSFFPVHLLCIFLAQTLHTFYKSSPSKWKFLDFPLLRLKFNKFLMSLFKLKFSFSNKKSVWIFFQCHER